jgi:hypothetical protein
MARNLGPALDIPAPGVMTSGQHMLWMLEELLAREDVVVLLFVADASIR